MRGSFIVSFLSFSLGVVETNPRQCKRVFPCGTGTRGCTRASFQDGSDRFGRLAGHSRCISCCNADRDFTLPCTSLTRAVALPGIMSYYLIAWMSMVAWRIQLVGSSPIEHYPDWRHPRIAVGVTVLTRCTNGVWPDTIIPVWVNFYDEVFT